MYYPANLDATSAPEMAAVPRHAEAWDNVFIKLIIG